MRLRIAGPLALCLLASLPGPAVGGPPTDGPPGTACTLSAYDDPAPDADDEASIGSVLGGPYAGEGTLRCVVKVGGTVHAGGSDVVAAEEAASLNGVAVVEPRTIVFSAGPDDPVTVCTQWRRPGGTMLFWHAPSREDPAGGHWTEDSATPCAPATMAGDGDGCSGDVGPDTPESDHRDLCCADPPTDEHGNVVGSAEHDEDVTVDRGSTADLYPGRATDLDTWYDAQPCLWSIGGTVPALDDFTDLDDQFADAGFTSSPADVMASLDRANEDLALQVNRPSAVEMLMQGRIPHRCERDNVLKASVAEQRVAAPPASCKPDLRQHAPDKPFDGADVIYVHGLDMDSIVDRLNGVAGASQRWPQDATAFTSPGGYWKQRADSYWNPHIVKYLKDGNAGQDPSNRYLTVAWPSTQWLPYSVHAFLSQVARAMATGDGVMADSSGSTDGFCAKGCVVVSHSTGGLISDVALAVARLTRFAPFSGLGNLAWLADRVDVHVAFAPAFGGSHYATVAAALGWATAVTPGLCELAQWVMENVFQHQIGCTNRTAFAESILTDLAPPITQTLWRPFAAITPVATLIVSTAHPTAVGTDDAAVKTFSPLIKMLFHHGFDDGVLSMDSQCATFGGWRRAPHSITTRSTVVDTLANTALLTNGLPGLVAARAFDMGSHAGRALRYYVDQVVGAQIATPQFWTAVTTPGALFPHFAASVYRTSSTCVPWLAPNGMVQQMTFPVHPGSALPIPLPNHYPFVMAAADHYSVLGPFGSDCYEVTTGTGNSCAVAGANREEVRTFTNPAIYRYVSRAMAGMVREEVKGRSRPFPFRRGPWRLWLWKRTYHRLAGWETKSAADYVYDYVLR